MLLREGMISQDLETHEDKTPWHTWEAISLSSKSGQIVSLLSYFPTCKRKPQLQVVAESRVPASPGSCVAIAAVMGWGSFQVSLQPLGAGFFPRG